MSRSRNRVSRPPSAQNVDGNLIHTDSNQKVYHETHLCLVHRHTLAAEEPYNGAKALSILEQNYRKRQAHGEAYMLSDRFILERSKHTRNEPFRNMLSYREIVDSHHSQTRPDFFVLGVHTLKGRRYYEVYKCKTPEQVNRFDSYLRKARSDPEFRLRDEPVVRERPFRVDQSRPRSLSVLEVQSPPEPSFEELVQPAPQVQVRADPPPAQIRTKAGVTYLEHKPHEGVIERPFAARYIFASNQQETPLDLHNRTHSGNLTYLDDQY